MLEGSILQQLEAAHQGELTGKRQLSFGVYYKNTLVSLCHALEDCILTTDSQPLVIAAFQRGKWYLQEADRYSQIAAQARQIVILAAPDAGFAEHPTGTLANVDLISLPPEDPVAQEWHLMILSPTYTAMVLCQELSLSDYGEERPQEDRQRKFYGLWTFETTLVQEAIQLAIAHIGQFNPELQAKLQAQVEEILAAAQPDQPHIYTVASRVVDYLQTNQQDLLPHRSHLQLDKNLLSNEIQALLRVAQLIDLMDAENPRAAAEVLALAEMIGQMLDLPGWQMKRLRLAALLHRLGPLQQAESLLKPAPAPDEPSLPLACPLIPGVQVLRQMPQLRAIAQIITHQTEWWNGSGQPAGLKAEEIPIESRILGLLADFQQRVPPLEIPKTINDGRVDDWQDQLNEALIESQKLMGERWEPRLVDLLSVLVNGLQQGLALPIKPPKFTHGLWLLEDQDVG
uniref:Putative sensor protein n=1 Tax=Cyanothece sp. (strain PCC 7425 / ATCC 29141) TaxID=395961 RepID=B8HX48_CYAP4